MSPGASAPRPTATPAQAALGLLVFLCVLLPWLNPFAGGPSPAVVPLLVGWGCSALLWWARPPGGGGMAWVVPALVLAALLPGLALGQGSDFAGLLAGLACMAAGYCFASAGQGAAAQQLAGAWLAAAVLSTLAGLLQYFQVASYFSPWVNGAGMGEAYGNLRQRNQFASLTMVGLVALAWLVAQGRLQRSAGALAALLAVGAAASASRTGLLQLACLLLLAWWWSGSLRTPATRVYLWALAAYLLAAVALPWLLALDGGTATQSALFRLTQDDGCSSRRVLWSNVRDLIAQRPWAGWGWGALDYAHYTTLYTGPRFCDILDNAHNLPLHLAVELGLPAAVLLLGALGWWVLRARPWAEKLPARQMAWGVLLVLALHSLLEYPLWYAPFQMAAGLALGLLWPRSRQKTANSEQNSPGAGVFSALFATLMLAAVAYAAWDYHRVGQIYLAPEERAAAYRADPMAHARQSWLFRNQVDFAELTTTDLQRNNAARVHALAQRLLVYSPEPRVVEKLIESAVMLGRDEEAMAHIARFKAAFPEAYVAWSVAHKGPASR
jgi:O-antigen ligase